MTLADKVKQAGVVGAGGAGFPAHVKLAAQADTVIANGAECEPLLHKDAVVMERCAAQIVEGVQLVMEAVGARTGVVAIKKKKAHAIEAIAAACRGTPVRVQLLGDYYPAGDEFDLVHTVTGRLIPPQGLPIHVGCVVQNVETLANIAAAAAGRPVTCKTITVAGAVQEPTTMTVPLGVSLRDCIAAAGGATTDEPVLFIGGLMMGETTDDLERPVTKTCTGVVVLPRTHRLVERKLRPATARAAVGKSACDQCRYCTELCPRYLLGYAVEPHQVMRTLAFTASGGDRFNEFAMLCCACGLCTLYACPEELYPKEACDEAKAVLRAAGVTKWPGPMEVRAHALRDGRRVPIAALVKKLAVQSYDRPAPWREVVISSRQLVLPLKQNAGAPCIPEVRPGDRLSAGDVLARPPAEALGAVLHAPLAATVAIISQSHIVLNLAS